MRVASIYSEGALTATPRDRLADAAVRMTVHRVGSLVVVDDGRIMGIITERDLVRAIADGCDQVSSTVAEYMTRDPVTVDPDDQTDDAATVMLDVGIRHLPVVHDGALLGTVSARDLLILEAWPQVDSDHDSVPDTAPIGHIERSRETA